MNLNPLGTDPLRRSLFRKTEKIVPPEVITSPQVVFPEIPVRLEVLTFYLGTEEFGIEVNRIKEIVRLVEITPVPKAPFFVEGIIDWRGEIVPVVSLKKMFRLGEEKYTLHTQIVITEIHKRSIGLITDATAEIITLGEEKMKPPVETIPLHNFLFAIAELEERLLLFLDLNKILSYEQTALLEMLTSPEEAIHPEGMEKKELTREEEKFRNILHQRALGLSKRKIIEEKEKKQVVLFSCSEEFFAVEINQVKEVVKPLKIVYLPSLIPYLAGIINLRGELVPVISLQELFGLIPITNGKMRIIITQVEKRGEHLVKIGLLVDKVYDVVSLPVDTFEPPLVTIEKDKIDYFSATAHWENKIFSLLNLENIVKSI